MHSSYRLKVPKLDDVGGVNPWSSDDKIRFSQIAETNIDDAWQHLFNYAGFAEPRVDEGVRWGSWSAGSHQDDLNRIWKSMRQRAAQGLPVDELTKRGSALIDAAQNERLRKWRA